MLHLSGNLLRLLIVLSATRRENYTKLHSIVLKHLSASMYKAHPYLIMDVIITRNRIHLKTVELLYWMYTCRLLKYVSASTNIEHPHLLIAKMHSFGSILKKFSAMGVIVTRNWVHLKATELL